MKLNDIDVLKQFINDDSVNVYYKEGTCDIIVDGNINIFNNEDIEYTHIPVKIHTLNGHIHWYGTMTSILKKGMLESFKNFPDIVNGDVIVFKNPNLTSMEGCPKYISGTLQCDRCNISDLTGIAEYVGNNCILDYNPITSFEPMKNMKCNGIISVIDTIAAYDDTERKYIQDISILTVSESDKISYN